MEKVKKYLKFFFQTKRVHPMHVFALVCFLITIVTLPFYIIEAIMQKDYFDLVLKSGMFLSFLIVCIGGYQAYQKNEKNNSQDFRNDQFYD